VHHVGRHRTQRGTMTHLALKPADVVPRCLRVWLFKTDYSNSRRKYMQGTAMGIYVNTTSCIRPQACAPKLRTRKEQNTGLCKRQILLMRGQSSGQCLSLPQISSWSIMPLFNEGPPWIAIANIVLSIGPWETIGRDRHVYMWGGFTITL